MDASKDIYKDSIGEEITDLDCLNMMEVVSTFTGKKISATFLWGTHPIYAVWSTSDVKVVVNDCATSLGYGIGDHCMFIVDFTKKSPVGSNPPRIALSAARRLNAQLKCTVNNYTNDFESNIINHVWLSDLARPTDHKPIHISFKRESTKLSKRAKTI